MKTILALLLLIVIISGWLFFFKEYKSAFEADQACHSEKHKEYLDGPNYGCDHDLETNQWLLYQVQPDSEPAKVLRRYRY